MDFHKNLIYSCIIYDLRRFKGYLSKFFIMEVILLISLLTRRDFGLDCCLNPMMAY